MAGEVPINGSLTPITPRAMSSNGVQVQPSTSSVPATPREREPEDADMVDEDDFIPSPTDKHPRRSFYYSSQVRKQDPEREQMLNELDRVELAITQNLQKIHHNLAMANAFILDSVVPTLDEFKTNATKIYRNVNHIKEFYENAANVNILTKEDVVEHTNDTSINNASAGDISINHRYKQNFSSSEISPSLIPDEMDQLSSINLSTLTAFNDESTAKTLRQEIHAEEYRELVTADANMEETGRNRTSQGDAEHNDTVTVVPPKATPTELSPESKRAKYMSDLVKGYESPPWEDPPELQSEVFLTPLRKKRRIEVSPHKVGAIEEPEDDVSIRFPMSPKYGGGGKLLRTEEGRRMALDFARSEMMINHPILSLETPNLRADEDPTLTVTFYTMDSNSTIDNPPQISVPLENPEDPEYDVVNQSGDLEPSNGNSLSDFGPSPSENPQQASDTF